MIIICNIVNYYLGATPSFHRLLSRPVALGNPLGTHWGPLGDPLGTLGDPLGIPWGYLGDPRGPLGIPRGSLGDPLGTTWRSSGTSWDPLGTPWRSLGDHLPVLLDTLGASWGFFGGNLELQRSLVGSQRGSRTPVRGSLGIISEASKAFTKRFAAICQNFQIYCKVFQKTRSGKIETFENHWLIS